MIFTECIGAIINIFIGERIDVEEPSNIRLMISPLERVPVQPKIIDMLLSLEFPSLFNGVLPLVRVKRESKWIVAVITSLSDHSGF